MKFKIAFFTLIYIVCFGSVKLSAQNVADGPYILHNTDGSARFISVSTDSILTDTLLTGISSGGFTFKVSSHDGKHVFDVPLHTIHRQDWKTENPEKVMVISDPHGNMECFVSVLRGNKVINDRYEWIYGKNHLMIIGDVFDRGKDVLPIFWLIYKLEKEAHDAGGQVSFLIGNHEPMVLAGDYRYMDAMYSQLAERLDMDYRELFSPASELGRWLLNRNTMQVIGDDLFVHAGLGAAFLEANLTPEQVNEEISRALFMTKKERNELSPLTKFLYGSEGPIWYRGMVRNDEKYIPLYEDTLDEILAKYRVKRIIVGHTIFPEVRTYYGGKVVTVNVDNRKNFKNVSDRGILIQNEHTFVINDKGIFKPINLYPVRNR